MTNKRKKVPEADGSQPPNTNGASSSASTSTAVPAPGSDGAPPPLPMNDPWMDRGEAEAAEAQRVNAEVGIGRDHLSKQGCPLRMYTTEVLMHSVLVQLSDCAVCHLSAPQVQAQRRTQVADDWEQNEAATSVAADVDVSVVRPPMDLREHNMWNALEAEGDGEGEREDEGKREGESEVPSRTDGVERRDQQIEGAGDAERGES